ncbi:MAG: TolC family protein [Planctomycetes bacterium]|nr:TolC family protein [Planctomycetota bacterium]
MSIRMLLLSACICAGLVSGCNESAGDGGWVERRALGRDVQTYRPPRKVADETASDVGREDQADGVMTLPRALGLALMQNPELKAFSWEVRVAEARQLQQGLMPNPTLNVEAEEVGGGGARSGFDGAASAVVITQLIELGGKREKRTKLASLEKQLAGWDYEGKRLDVFGEVTKAFVAVLAAQQRVELSDELVDLSEQVLNTVQQRVKAGLDSPVEETKAQVALSTVSIELDKARRALDVSRKKLAASWAGASAVFDEAQGEFDSAEPVGPLDEVAGLVEDNPHVARWGAQVQRHEAALELEKARGIQDVTISGGMQRFNETNDNAMVIGVSIPIGMFDRNQGNIRAARYKLAGARQERKAVRIRIQTQLTESYGRLLAASHEATALRDEVLTGARSVFEASQTGYAQGKLDYLNVLDAQRTLFRARAQYIDSLASYHSARADVERLIAQPLDNENLLESEGL